VVQREAVVFAREAENEEQERKTRDDVAAKVVKRVVQKMAEGDDDQNTTERDKRVARAQANDDERAGNQFNERNGNADGPKRPSRQERVVEWQEIFSGVLERAEVKYFHYAGHQEDEAENKSGQEESQSAIETRSHR
jgi:hypothetical protein